MNLIFDFDGTIADTLDEWLDIANRFLKFFRQKPVTKEEVRKKGTLALYKSLDIPKIILPLIVLYGRWKIRKRITKLSLSFSSTDFLHKVTEEHKLGILTTNSKKNVEKFLEKNFKKNPFDFIQTDISYINKSKRIQKTIEKYSLKLQETIYIGDETRDIIAAKKVGIKSIAVTWGFESEKILKTENPDYLVKNPKSLLKTINSLG